MIIPPQDKGWMAAIGSQLPIVLTIAYLVPIWGGLRLLQQSVIGDERAVLAAIVLFGGAALLLFVVTFIHEMGHAIAAWGVGHKVHFICVGPFGVSPAQMKLTRIGDAPDREYAGFVASTPKWGQFRRGAAIWVSAGGAMATAACAIIIYMAAQSVPDLMLGLSLIALAFLIDAIVNLIPLIWDGRSASDGLHIWQYMAGYRPGPESWAATRLNYIPPGLALTDDEEWARISVSSGPFMRAPAMVKLIMREAQRRAETAVLSKF
ncbi:zinc metalloprotease [Robiginitomaculum antarcticum]|uniref:hypothetical protein n=1 Tax=Robiginitomaculum antarcticum TaxID=437507 RepID=UPI000372A3D9|nr:hypothetical protein [Robiginitomaculum antarcticum]